MLSLIEQNRPKIAQLCQKYAVKRLDLFGSAARGEFDDTQSDLDFLVLFDSRAKGDRVERYFGLQQELERLFHRKIDLVDIAAAKNPYFVAEALRYRVKLHAA